MICPDRDVPKVIFVVPHGRWRSGLQVLAYRWAACVSQNRARVVHAPEWAEWSRHGVDICVLVGLPKDRQAASDLLETTARCKANRKLLLWERFGHKFETVSNGLSISRELQLVFPRESDVDRIFDVYEDAFDPVCIPAPVPDVFFESSRTPQYPRGIFVGRFSRDKGTLRLASLWAEHIYPITGANLLLIGSNLRGSDCVDELVDMAKGSESLRVAHLASDEGRARAIASSSMALFLGVQDYYPQALLEVIASGVPVISTGIPGYRPAIEYGSSTVVDRDDEVVNEIVNEFESPMDYEALASARNQIRDIHSEFSVSQSFRLLLDLEE